MMGKKMEVNIAAVSRKTKKISPDYILTIEKYTQEISKLKTALVSRVKIFPQLIELYDCLRLSVDILKTYKKTVNSAPPTDNPLVIESALSVLEAIQNCHSFINGIDFENLNRKELAVLRDKGIEFNNAITESGQPYLPEFNELLLSYNSEKINKISRLFNETIVSEF